MKDGKKTKSDLVADIRALREQLALVKKAEAARQEGLRKRRDAYRPILDSMIERIWRLDTEGRVLYVNKAGARDIGLPVEEIIGKPLHRIFPHPMASRLSLDNMEVMASGKAKLGVSEEHFLANGTKVYFQTDKIPFFDARGEIAGVLIFAIDFTAHMLAEEALSTSRMQLSEAMDLASIVYWQLDLATDTFIFNDPFYAFYGTTAEKEGGYLMSRAEYARRFVHPDDVDLFDQASEKRLVHKGSDFFNETEHRIIRRDGQMRHVLARIRANIDPSGRITRCFGANQDITGRKQAQERFEQERLFKEAQIRREKALEQSREELRNLSEHLQRVRERERTRIARQVHDELGQFLSVLKIDLTCLGQGLDADQGEVLDQIQGIANRIDTAVHTVRKICSELRPSILDDFGLPVAIEWHAEDFQKRTGVRFITRIDPAIPAVEKRLALVFFRIFQETVTNVLLHAQATTVKVSLRKDAGNLVLKVADNGKGISKKELSSPDSFGIIGMRERVRFWNGQLLFSSARNKGTSMTVSIPLAASGRSSEDVDYPEDGYQRAGGGEE